MSDDCLFCSIASGATDTKLLYDEPSVVAFQDINPQAPTHLLIVPRDHIATVNDLEPGQEELVGELFTAARRLADRLELKEDGYRLVMNCGEGAGQSVFHIHLHLLAGRPFSWPPG